MAKQPRIEITLAEARAEFEIRDGRLYRYGSDTPVRERLKDPKAYQRTKTMSGKRVKIHRLLFLLGHGYLPEIGVIDHWNRQPHDNRLENLRAVSYRENKLNSTSTARSGFRGVDFHRGKWRVRIPHPTKGRIFVGHYLDLMDAAEAYNEAVIKHNLQEFIPLNPTHNRKQA